MVECIFAKLCCIDGVLGDASVFIPIEKETIYSRLKEKNFNKYGNEILYNGYTGTQIETEIFIGPTFYFRLKHMVAEKINSRGIGKVMGLTRQPTEGRRKGGGLRIGEMERDTVLSHGISNFIKESMMERSDKFSWCICKRCGTLVAFNIKENINLCRNCNNDDVAVIQTPYAFKLFIQELETMGIQPRLNTEFIDMPIEQAELVRNANAGGDGGADDGARADRAGGADGVNAGDDDAGAADDSDIDDALFNLEIDNFATKNTIVDEKTWKDTYDNNFVKMKGGMYDEEEEEEEQEGGNSDEDEEEEEAEGGNSDEDDETTEEEQEGGNSDVEEEEEEEEEETTSKEGSVSDGSVSSNSEGSGVSEGEEIWNDEEATGDAKETGAASDIKELYIEM